MPNLKELSCFKEGDKKPHPVKSTGKYLRKNSSFETECIMLFHELNDCCCNFSENVYLVEQECKIAY